MAAVSMVECDGCKKRAQPSVDSMAGWSIVSIYNTMPTGDLIEMEPLDFCSLDCLKQNFNRDSLIPKKVDAEPESERET